MSKTLRFLFLGDVVGGPGQVMCQKWIPRLRKDHSIDAVLVNGENSANNGKGIQLKQLNFFKHLGVSVVTSGNHIFDQRDCHTTLTQMSDFVIRPANFPSDCPGKGYTFFEVGIHTIGIMNIQGRVFMSQHLACPFKTAESLLTLLQSKAKIIFVDCHAETTSEKQALGHFLDGKVSGVVGTHTHVQTADEVILPQGTAYITDLGFGGALYSCLGMKKESILRKYLTQMPQRFEVDKTGPFVLTGLIIEVDTTTGKAVKVERIRVVDDELEC